MFIVRLLASTKAKIFIKQRDDFKASTYEEDGHLEPLEIVSVAIECFLLHLVSCCLAC
jgi:hypothetical protein